MPSTTITMTAGQAQRTAAAYGRKLNLRDVNGALINATEAQIKAEWIRMIKLDVLEQEQAAAREAANAGVSDLGSVT